MDQERPTLRAGYYPPEGLAALAAEALKRSGLKKKDAAAELGVTPAALTDATNDPKKGLHALRARIIERWGGYVVEGPLYRLRRP